MELTLLTPAQKAAYSDAIYAVLEAGDEDFVPPLSTRFSTSDTSFSARTDSKKGIDAYFNSMMKEEMLAAVEDGKLLGFVTFMPDFTCKYIDADSFPNIYICTLLLAPEARGKGLTAKMYTHLFDTLYPHANLYTRTWSTNAAHIKILTRFGFSQIARIENDRGEGIDTVYFGKKRH